MVEVANKSIWTGQSLLKEGNTVRLVTTWKVGAGEGETGRLRGRCLSPGGTAEPGGWRGTPSSARSPELRCRGEEILCHPPCEDNPPLWCCHKRQPPSDPVETTGTGEYPVGQLAVPRPVWITPPGGCPTGLKRSDDRDGHPTPRLRRLTRSVGRETPGRETLLEIDEGDGATTGGREDTPSTHTLEPRDPGDPKIDGGRAGGNAFSVCRQELGEPAKKVRRGVIARSTREVRRRTETLRLLTAAVRRAPPTEKP